MKCNSPGVLYKWRKPLASAMAILLLGEAPITAAAIFKELSEGELADMRGKFVIGNHIEYFGMSVSTQWTRQEAFVDSGPVNGNASQPVSTDSHRQSQNTGGVTMNANGPSQAQGGANQLSIGGHDIGGSQYANSAEPALAANNSSQAMTNAPAVINAPQAVANSPIPESTHEVRLNLQVDNSGPEAKVAYSVGGTLGTQVPNTPAPAPNAALSQINGAVQSIQVAGSDNVVENHVRYAVIPSDTAPVLTDAQVAKATPVDQTFVNGDVVTHVIANNGIGFTITSQGNQITQQLGMNPVSNTNQLLQSVQLKANGQRVVNDLMLQVAFDKAMAQSDSFRFRADRAMNLL